MVRAGANRCNMGHKMLENHIAADGPGEEKGLREGRSAEDKGQAEEKCPTEVKRFYFTQVSLECRKNHFERPTRVKEKNSEKNTPS